MERVATWSSLQRLLLKDFQWLLKDFQGVLKVSYGFFKGFKGFPAVLGFEDGMRGEEVSPLVHGSTSKEEQQLCVTCERKRPWRSVFFSFGPKQWRHGFSKDFIIFHQSEAISSFKHMELSQERLRKGFGHCFALHLFNS